MTPTRKPLVTLPRAVLPVVRVLRRDVARPPKSRLEDEVARWPASVACNRFNDDCCPMGLHPAARDRVPVDTIDLPIFCLSDKAIESFYKWWDSLTLAEARAAVDLIWPRARVRTRRTRKGNSPQ